MPANTLILWRRAPLWALLQIGRQALSLHSIEPMKITGLRKLYNFPGWCVNRVEFGEEESHVWLERDQRAKLHCLHCGMVMTKNRERERTAKDLPLGISTVVTIHYRSIQGRCRACNTYSTIHPEQITDREQSTWRFRLYVARLAQWLPLNRIGELLSIHETTALRYNRSVLEKTVPKPCLDGLRVLLIDEKAVRRGHNYVTVVINGETGEPLYMHEGKKGASLSAFFDQLTEEQKSTIEAVGIDRAGSYKKAIEEHLPDAAIVFDKFHLVANLNQAIDEVRRASWRVASKEDKAFIKGQRYNLFRAWDRSTPEQQWSLTRLFNANADLNAAYILREAFGHVWDYAYPKCAENYLRTWVAWAEETGIPALQRFSRGAWRARAGIIAFCKHGITNGKIEAFNNQIARVLHRACGIRSLRYLFLQMRQQFLSANRQ